MKALKKLRDKSSSPLSRRTKTVASGSKEKKGGLLGQDKLKVKGETATYKEKKRMGRTVSTTREGGKKSKDIRDKEGNLIRRKTKEKLFGRATKSMEKGGKVVAQGATKKDVRREKRQARKSGRKA